MRALRLPFLPAALLAVAAPGRAAVLQVPGDHPTISLAVAAAAAGDSVAVGPGVWAEGAEIVLTVPLTLYSTAGAEATVLDGQDAYRILQCVLPGPVAIRGFSFVRGLGGPTTLAGGAILAAQGAALDVEDCVFADCFAEQAGALYIAGGPTTLAARRCRFVGNASTVTAGAAYIVIDAVASFEECVFRANTTITYAGAVMAHRAMMDFDRCLFVGNRSDNVAGALYYGTDATGSVRNCTFFDHTSPGNVAGTIVAGAGTEISRSILAGETHGYAVRWYTGFGAHACNVYWDDAGGAMNAPLSPSETVADPLFCDAGGGSLYLQWGSPCLPANSVAGCGLVGAFGPGGCNAISVAPESWSRVKGRFRTGGGG